MNDEGMPTQRHELRLRTASGECAITIQPGALGAIGALVRNAVPDSAKALLVVDAAVERSLVPRVRTSLESAGVATSAHAIEARESNKTLATVEAIYAAMLDAGLERSSLVVALGGGIVCDLAGFAAATFHRGVPVVMAPTTLLAMVDASIGGKNGVNFGSAGGPLKNMIGTVWQPRAIVSDPEALATLPMRHVRCGLAECIKIAMLRDEALLPMIADDAARVDARDWDAVAELVARCAAIKASIVEADEREEESSAGGRAILNLGHTFAHAFELIESLKLLHGEAVAIGLCAAAFVARRTDRISAASEERWRDVIAQIGLPVALPRSVPATTLLDLMRRDKKVRHGRLRLVLPTATGGAELVDDVDESLIRDALIGIGAE